MKARSKLPRAPSEHEATFALQLRAHRIIPWEREYRFHPDRKWRFDFAFPAHNLAIEIEGAIWVQGRHTRGAGFLADLTKYAEAAVMGWRVIRLAPEHIKSGQGIEWVKLALGHQSE